VDALGAAVDSPVIRRTPEPRRLADGAIQGEVIAIDRFGNAVTNLLAARGGTLEVAGRALPIRRTYADVPDASPTALAGSTGLIEVALRDGNAARALGLRRGSAVILRPRGQAGAAV
jgi:S-adenosylmethionine hydrolase